MADQRRIDMETFGGTGIARRGGYGRGRGRGRVSHYLWWHCFLTVHRQPRGLAGGLFKGYDTVAVCSVDQSPECLFRLS